MWGCGRHRTVQGMGDVLGAKQLLAESLSEGGAQRFGAVTGQQFVQALDIPYPQPWAPISEFGEVVQRRSAQFEQMLALQVALGTLTRHRRHLLSAVFGQVGALAGGEQPPVDGFKAPGHDANPLPIQVQGAGDADRLRRHRIAVTLVGHDAGRTDHDR